MKKLLILPILALTLAACSSPTPAPSGAINVSGGWTGTVTSSGDAGPTSTPLTLQLVQAMGSDDITGTAFNQYGTGTLTGKFSTGILKLVDKNGLSADLVGTFTATTYKGTIETADTPAGTFSFTKNP